MIDEEIREALDVDPSPEFLARVRTRIAAEPAPSAWRWSWGLAAGCAAAASIVLAILVSRTHEATPGAKVERVPNVVAATPLRPAVGTLPDIGPRYGPLPSRAANANTNGLAAQTAPSEPEILIDPREMRTLQALIEGVRDGRIDLTAAQNSTPHAPVALEPVTDIVIPPLVIEPIAPESGAEGVTRDQAR
jgi:hypothetical protein